MQLSWAPAASHPCLNHLNSTNSSGIIRLITLKICKQPHLDGIDQKRTFPHYNMLPHLKYWNSTISTNGSGN